MPGRIGDRLREAVRRTPKPELSHADFRVRPKPASGQHNDYYLVAGVPLDREMERLRHLPVFSDGPLVKQRPDLRIRRAARKPNRLGFAVPREFRLSVTAYPGIRVGDVLETLVHELTHLHVGRADEAHAWHGATFKHALGEAMYEAYGLMIPVPRHTRHGVYAEAIERAEGKASRPMRTTRVDR